MNEVSLIFSITLLVAGTAFIAYALQSKTHTTV